MVSANTKRAVVTVQRACAMELINVLVLIQEFMRWSFLFFLVASPPKQN